MCNYNGCRVSRAEFIPDIDKISSTMRKYGFSREEVETGLKRKLFTNGSN
jgi:hypothetical protein